MMSHYFSAEKSLLPIHVSGEENGKKNSSLTNGLISSSTTIGLEGLPQALKKEIVAQLKQLLLQALKTKFTGENHDK